MFSSRQRSNLAVSSYPLQCCIKVFQGFAPQGSRRCGECPDTLTIRVESGKDLPVGYFTQRMSFSALVRSSAQAKDFSLLCSEEDTEFLDLDQNL